MSAWPPVFTTSGENYFENLIIIQESHYTAAFASMTQVNEIRRIENSDVGDPDALIVVRTHRASTSRVRVIYFTVLLIGNYDTSKFEMRGVNYVEKHKVSNRTDLTEISSKPNQIELIRKILSHACLNFFCLCTCTL
jgi:hypothetical protein